MTNSLDAPSDNQPMANSTRNSYDPSADEHDSWSVPNPNVHDTITVLLVGNLAKLTSIEQHNEMFDARVFHVNNNLQAGLLLERGIMDVCIAQTTAEQPSTLELLDYIATNHDTCASIVLTGEGSKQQAMSYYDAGASDVWDKDVFDVNAMVHVVQSTYLRAKTSAQYREEMSRMSNHLANMAHELKNPLNAIMGFNKLLNKSLAQSAKPRQTECLARIDRNASRMNQLIDEMLDLGAISMDAVDLKYEQLDILLLVSDVCENLKPYADSHGLFVNYPASGSGAFLIQADPSRMHQIISNLISNGLKYTVKGGITVSLSFDNNEILHIKIQDTGIGIRANDFSAIFDQFKKVHHNIGKEVNSTGLGLPITLELVKKHQGRISVESQYEMGSTFTVSLPKAPDLLVPGE